MFIQTLALEKWEPAGRKGDIAKSPRMLRSSWILNELSLYCKIVKYCFLSKVCMIKTVSITGREIRQFVTRWSRSSSNFYAVIGQNLTGEFMRKIYAAS